MSYDLNLFQEVTRLKNHFFFDYYMYICLFIKDLLLNIFISSI